MLDRKIYQLSREGKEVWIFLRDQGRWIERARILDIEGDIILVRYETEDDEEICSWEEIIRMESIGTVSQRLSTIPKGIMLPNDLPVADECPEAEMIFDQATLESSRDELEALISESLRLGEDHPISGIHLEREVETEPLKRSEISVEEPKKSRDSHPDSNE
jgi:hypothetical protein